MSTIRLYCGRDREQMLRNLERALTSDEPVSSVEVRKTLLEDEVIDAIINLVWKGSVEKVYLDDCGAHLNKPAVRMSEALGNCKHVHLSESTFLSKFFLESLLVSATKMRSLRIQDSLLSEQVEALTKGLRSNNTLRTLDLSRSRVENFSLLAKGLRGSCAKTLKLRSIGLQNHHVEFLLSSLESCPSLESLDLSFNHLQDTSPIGRLLRNNNCKLKELQIGYQNLWQEHRIDISAISKALTVNKRLKTLDLPRNELDDSCALGFGTALAKNCTLENLDIRENNITDFGVTVLAETAMTSKSLRKLKLGSNPFGTIGSLALLEAVSKNYNLFEIDGNSKVNDEDINRHMNYHTILNRGGRKLLLEEPPLALWPCVIGNSCQDLHENVDVDAEATIAKGNKYDINVSADLIFYVLRQNPRIFFH